jgi:CoA:oxalate CoA-transferase
MTKLRRPLDGVTVLDLTMALAGPYTTLLLAGLGARVIKIENPVAGDSSRSNSPYLGRDGVKLARTEDDDISVSAINRLRNKLGITLNLKHVAARDVISDLIRISDVVVENFSAGTLDRLGIGYSFAKEINPRLVYCSITGFGTTSDAPQKKALDLVIQALSGAMYASGNLGDPPARCGFSVADMNAALFGVIGVLAALHQVGETGKGQHVDVSMLGVMTSMIGGESYDALHKCGIPTRTGQTVPRLAPFGTYPASNGYVAICAHTQEFAESLSKVMGISTFTSDPRFSNRDSRVKYFDALDALVSSWTRSHTKEEIVALLDEAGVPAAEVRAPDEAIRDPRVVARCEIVPLVHPKYGSAEEVWGMGLPITFSDAVARFDQPPPALGGHNEEVYGNILGYSSERIQSLRNDRVI